MRHRDLTELEHCVLGVVWRDGPVTAYEIAALFARSLTPFWSGSAGAIYPVVQRLKKRGLIRGAYRAWRGSRRTVLTISTKGRDAIREWLMPPLPEEIAAPALDSLRTRTFFLDILKPAERKTFLEEAIRAVNAQLALVNKQRKVDDAAGNVSEVIGAMGAEEQLKGRLRWLKKIRDRF
jgi:DNA-binding PadR family transcriptional regulator